MIKFLIVSRHKPHEDQQTFFYNWAIIHVALMLTTPIVFFHVPPLRAAFWHQRNLQ